MFIDDSREWNVTFLVDSFRPLRLVLLQRGADRPFAPGWYTGVGGKVDATDASRLAAAARELREETGLVGTDLKEFAHAWINENMRIAYFVLPYTESALPKCNEGDLLWADEENLFDLKIIPTTKIILEKWRDRAWDTENPFTVVIEREDVPTPEAPIRSVSLEEGIV